MRTYQDIYRIASLMANDPELFSECVEQRIVYRVTQEEFDALRTHFGKYMMQTARDSLPIVTLRIGALRVEPA